MSTSAVRISNQRPLRAATIFAALICLSGLAFTSPAAQAQLRPLVIRNATILVGDGSAIEAGEMVLQGGKIADVGRKVHTPLLARKLDAQGKFITPGLIDVHSMLTLGRATGGGRAVARAADAFDRYAVDDLKSAWSQGITAVYLPARADGGIGGLGAVLRLSTHEPRADIVLTAEAALCGSVGVDERAGPLAQVKVADELRRKFQAAKDYREAREDYEEALEEYEKKLAERVKKHSEAAEKGDKEKPAAAPGAAKKTSGRKRASNDDKKQDELKKPAEPATDRDAEMLLKVLDGELRLRIEAHSPADILNVLDMVEEFNPAFILEGATGAHLVADRLAALHVPVVLSGPLANIAYTSGTGRDARPDAAEILRHAGVKVYFGSGAFEGGPAPGLTLRAAHAVGHGFDSAQALRALMADAAQLLGQQDQIGLLESGRTADLVVWSDHPFAPGAHVERVYVGGREVYRADRDD